MSRAKAGREVVIVHTSDLHIDEDIRPGRYHGLEGLRHVLRTASALAADLVVLAGDTFDSARVPEPIARQAGAIVAEAAMPVVVLPGNHDPAVPDGIFHRSGMLGLPRTMVLGITHPDTIVIEGVDLEIVGRPHRSYGDMPPLPETASRQARWQVVVAHGHYVPSVEWAEQAHRSWRMSDADIDAVTADYIALGHWDRPVTVGEGRMRAHYSGAPDLAQTINLVRLDPVAGASVARHPLAMPFPRRW